MYTFFSSSIFKLNNYYKYKLMHLNVDLLLTLHSCQNCSVLLAGVLGKGTHRGEYCFLSPIATMLLHVYDSDKCW